MSWYSKLGYVTASNLGESARGPPGPQGVQGPPGTLGTAVLDDLNDVDASTGLDGHTLRYDGSFYVSDYLTTNDLSNVTSNVSTAEGDILQRDGTLTFVSVPLTLNKNVDVNAGAPTDKDVLQYDNGTSKWINGPIVHSQEFTPTVAKTGAGTTYFNIAVNTPGYYIRIGDVVQFGMTYERDIVDTNATSCSVNITPPVASSYNVSKMFNCSVTYSDDDLQELEKHTVIEHYDNAGDEGLTIREYLNGTVTTGAVTVHVSGLYLVE